MHHDLPGFFVKIRETRGADKQAACVTCPDIQLTAIHTAHSTQHTAHSTQHKAHSTQHTAQSTQHTAHST